MEYTLPKEESMPKQQKTYTQEFKLEAVQVWAIPPPISPQPTTPLFL